MATHALHVWDHSTADERAEAVEADRLFFVPAIFCGTFFGGLIPLMSRLVQQEAQVAARPATTAPAVPETQPAALPAAA